MKYLSRWPIPECIMNRPRRYWLKVDSIIHAIYNFDELKLQGEREPDYKVPKNSDISEEEFSFGESSDEYVVEKDAQ